MKLMRFLEGSGLRARVIQGAVACTALSVFNWVVIGDHHANAGGAWNAVLTALVLWSSLGAIAGAMYYFTDGWRRRAGWHATVANVTTIVVPGILALVALGIVVAIEN